MTKLFEVFEKKNVAYLLIGMAFFAMNGLIFFYIDDYRYAFIFPTYNRVHTITDLFLSMKEHWLLHGGRIPAHVLASFFMLFNNKLVFNIFNTLCMMSTVFFISDIACSEENKPKGMLLLVTFELYWLFNPCFGQTSLWLTGACNYLWMPMIQVCSLWLIKRGKICSKQGFSLGILIFFLAGWGNENSSLAVLLLHLVYCIIELYRSKKIDKKYVICIVSMVIGYVLMIFAPGNNKRSGDALINSFFEQFINRMSSCTSILIKYYSVLLILCLTVLIIFLCRKNVKTENGKKVFLQYSLFLFTALICNYIMVASPYYPERSSIGTMIFLIISFLTLLTELNIKEPLLKMGVFVFLSVLFFNSVVFHGWIMIQQYRYEKDVLHQIETKIQEGLNHVIVISEIHAESSKYCLNYDLDYTISQDPNYWVNQYAAHYYGVDSLSVIHKEQNS